MVKLEEAIKSAKFKNQVHKAGLNILYSAWWLKTLMSRELKVHSITLEQYNVLRILKGKYPEQMCVRDIACRMIEKNSNVPRIIDRLEVKHLVKRSTSAMDKRETVITITEEGISTLQASTHSIDKLIQQKINLDEQAALQLNTLLEKWREAEG